MIFGGMIVFFTGQKHGIGKMGMMHAIGHLLRFKTKPEMRSLAVTAPHRQLPVKEIGRIEMQRGLRGIKPHFPAAWWMGKRGAMRKSAVSTVKAIAMVKAARCLQRGKIRIDIRSHRFGNGKIHRCTRHGKNTPRGKAVCLIFQIMRSIQPQLMIAHGIAAIPCQIEIGMLG